jgi:hypothetical protein
MPLAVLLRRFRAGAVGHEDYGGCRLEGGWVKTRPEGGKACRGVESAKAATVDHGPTHGPTSPAKLGGKAEITIKGKVSQF